MFAVEHTQVQCCVLNYIIQSKRVKGLWWSKETKKGRERRRQENVCIRIILISSVQVNTIKVEIGTTTAELDVKKTARTQVTGRTHSHRAQWNPETIITSEIFFSLSPMLALTLTACKMPTNAHIYHIFPSHPIHWHNPDKQSAHSPVILILLWLRWWGLFSLLQFRTFPLLTSFIHSIRFDSGRKSGETLVCCSVFYRFFFACEFFSVPIVISFDFSWLPYIHLCYIRTVLSLMNMITQNQNKYKNTHTHTTATKSSILAVAHAIPMYTKCNSVVIVVEIAHAAQNQNLLAIIRT